MKNFGIKQIGFHQTGTVKGGLQPQQYSGSWGDRGQGNELQSAFENGLSWIGDKIMNAGDYIDQGLAYLTGLIPGGMTADESLQDTRLAQSARNAGELGYMDIYGKYQMFPNTGVAPLPTPLKNPSPELSKMYDGLKKLRWNVQIRESQLRKAGQLDMIESTRTAKKYRDAEQAYLNAVEEFKANQPHMKRMTSDVVLTRKQDASFKRNKAAATGDGRANNQGRPVLKERQWDWVEEMMRKDPKAAGAINRYEIKVAKGLDKKHLREARKKMLEEYAKSRPGFFDYLLKKNE